MGRVDGVLESAVALRGMIAMAAVFSGLRGGFAEYVLAGQNGDLAFAGLSARRIMT